MRIVMKSTPFEETAHKVMRALGLRAPRRTLALAMTLALSLAAPGLAADTIRLAVQKTGTFSWELAAQRYGEILSQLVQSPLNAETRFVVQTKPKI